MKRKKPPTSGGGRMLGIARQIRERETETKIKNGDIEKSWKENGR